MREISLKRYVLRRVVQAIPLILGIITITFLLIHLAPGDPVSIMVGGFEFSPEYLEMMREQLGLNKPIYEQLFLYLAKVFQGDLGYSYRYNQPVISLIAERVPATLLLMGTAYIISIIIGIVLGVSSSRKPYSLLDNIITTGSLMGYSIPLFWLAQMLLVALALYLGLFPVGGMMSVTVKYIGLGHVLDILHHLILPAAALAVFNLALYTRLTRASMLEVLEKDFIVTAKCKGVDERTVVYRHALRNALLPVITVIGMQFGAMLGGAILTETIFGWPGLGRLMYEALYTRDYPVMMGMFIVASISVIVANLMTDLVYAMVDPRIRYR